MANNPSTPTTAKKLVLNPGDFREQVSAYQSAGGILSGVKYDVPKGALILQSIDKLQTCIDEFNSAVSLMNDLVSKDVYNLNQILAIWSGMDVANAQTTVMGKAKEKLGIE